MARFPPFALRGIAAFSAEGIEFVQDFSRDGEQAIIEKFFGDFIGRFLDIGAYDGVTGSNSRALAMKGWSGLCVEPGPAQFAKLVRLYQDYPPVELLHAAVICGGRIADYWDSDTANGHPCSSCVERIGVKRKAVRYKITGVRASDIAGHFGMHWDFVSIDVEGMEADILRECAPLLNATKLLCVEECHFRTDTTERRCVRIARSLGFATLVGKTVIHDHPDRFGNILMAR